MLMIAVDSDIPFTDIKMLSKSGFGIVIAPNCTKKHITCPCLRTFRYDVDCSAERSRTVNRRSRSTEHFDTVNQLNRKIEIEITGAVKIAPYIYSVDIKFILV